MLTNQQINTIHRLHFVENWTVRKIARHLHIGRRTVAKYLIKPAQAPLHRTRTSKLDPFKPAIDEWLQQDSSVTAAVLFQRLRDQGFAGGYTIVKDHLQAVRSETKTRRAFVRMEPAAGERFEIDWGHFGALVYNGTFLGFAREYGFVPRACHVAAAWEKGKVERAIGYVRQNFWPLRRFIDLPDVNSQAHQWLHQIANQRRHRESGQTPEERFRPECLRPLTAIELDYRDNVDVLVYNALRLCFICNCYV